MVVNRLKNANTADVEVEQIAIGEIVNIDDDGNDGMTDWVTAYLEDGTYVILSYGEIRRLVETMTKNPVS